MQMKELELLAPAGKWDVLEPVIESGADAVYLGGKGFNMRMLQPEFNFSEQEIAAATDWLHEKNKKLYITVNNLYTDREINQIKDYLAYLEEVKVDGLIVQDMGIVQVHKEMGLTIPLHASVQMGIGNSAAVNLLTSQGFTRVVLSKNLNLEEIEAISRQANLEIEYFVHGDLCIAHTGQCLMSSYLAGESSNRGRCLKPCRWQYVSSAARKTDYGYLLASKDLCLYHCLPDMIKAGVVSFKIEGRMRSKEYLSHLVAIYRRALDRIIEDPAGYSLDQAAVDKLEKGRIRNFTVGNLYGSPDKPEVDPSGSREPFFISRSVQLRPLPFSEKPAYASKADLSRAVGIKELTVKVSNPASAVQAMQNGADNLIISLEKFRQAEETWDNKKISRIIEMGKQEQVKVWLETPRIVTEKDTDFLAVLAVEFPPEKMDGVLVNDWGSLKICRERGYQVSGGSGLNIANQAAATWAVGQGLFRITASPELNFISLASLLQSEAKIELTVQGPLCGLITDHCLAGPDQAGNCALRCLEQPYQLLDIKGQAYRIRTDHNCRNYIFHPYELCLFNYLISLGMIGARYLRIDGQFYDSELTGQVTAAYRQAIDRIGRGEPWLAAEYEKFMALFPQGLTSLPVYTEE